MNVVPGRNILVQVPSESHDPVSPPTFISVLSWGNICLHITIIIIITTIRIFLKHL